MKIFSNIKNWFTSNGKKSLKKKPEEEQTPEKIIEQANSIINSTISENKVNTNSTTTTNNLSYTQQSDKTNLNENNNVNKTFVITALTKDLVSNKENKDLTSVEETQNVSSQEEDLKNVSTKTNIINEPTVKYNLKNDLSSEQEYQNSNLTSVSTTNDKTSNQDVTKSSENNEILLEEEYKKLKLDLKELEKKPSGFSKSTKDTKINYFWFLKLFNIKWLFSAKLLIVATLIVATFIVYVLWYLPDYTILEQYKPNTVTRVYSSDGFIMSELGIQNRSITNINDIPEMVKNAFISVEDKTFYTNYGFDFKGIVRATFNNILRLFDKNRSLMGASTITQQVVKNLLLNHDRTFIRKIKEAILTVKLEQNLSKERILELYLNEIYLGRASYGVTTAALNYFNKSLNSLTLAEAALLAILPRSPNGYNPTTNYNGAKARRDWAINRMLEDGKITQEEAESAINEPIVLAKRTNLSIEYSSYAAEEVRKKVFNIIPGEVVYSQGLIINTTINNELQKYAYFALRNGIENVDNLKGYRGPLTNLLDKVEDSNSENLNWEILLNNYINNNVNIQKGIGNRQFAVVLKIEKDYLIAGLENGTIVNLNIKHNTWAVPNQEVYQLNKPIKKLTNFNSILKEYDVILLENQLENNSEIWLLKQIPKVNGAIVVMNPINGYILAMQGGYSYNLSQFNRSTQALRQPGSAFKAFVYLAALEKGMTPASLVLDAPYTSENNFQIWKPKNNTSRYAGYVTMRNALEVSRNLASIRIAHFAGLDAISDVSKRLGIYNNSLTNFSEVIGSKETTLLKMVKAYAVLANGGKNVEPVLVNKISNSEGDIIFKNDTRVCENCNNVEWHNQKVPSLPESKDILVDRRNAYLITNMLEGVVNNGIAWRAKVPGYDIGGKTGTTNESKDLWFFGFTPQVVVGIFIGEDIPTSLEPAMASTMVVPIFQDFASQAFPLLFDKIPFKIPDGIEMKWIDPKTGQPVLENSPKKFLESFRADNLPKKEETHAINGPMGEGVYTDDGIY